MTNRIFRPQQVERGIQKRLAIGCTLELSEPAYFGTDQSASPVDLALLKDEAEFQIHWQLMQTAVTPRVHPLLTGSSLAGALRAYLTDYQGEAAALVHQLFGGKPPQETDENASLQSALLTHDALGELPKGSKVEIRDGVRLDLVTGTAYEEALYSRECWPKGTSFSVWFELILAKGDNEAKLKEALLTALYGLESQEITLGGRKTRGYGRIKITEWQYRAFDFTQKTDVLTWLEEGQHPFREGSYSCDWATLKKHLGDVLIPDQRTRFIVKAWFNLTEPLLIRGRSLGPAGQEAPDMEPHQNHQKEFLIAGTSWGGALRQKAYEILRHLGKQHCCAAETIRDLFGQVALDDLDDNKNLELHTTERKRSGPKPDATISRLHLRETRLNNVQADWVQTRIAIDPFTGGTRDTALFNLRPIFKGENTSPNSPHVCLELEVRKPKAQDIGLVLLLLKDLWLGDLPLGGMKSIGFGRLEGTKAEIHYATPDKKRHISLTGNPFKLSPEDTQWLNEQVTALVHNS